MSIGGVEGWFQSGPGREEPRAWWGRAKRRGGAESSKNVWFGGSSDAIDAEGCIISITKSTSILQPLTVSGP